MTPGCRGAPGVFCWRRGAKEGERLKIFLIALFGAIGTLARYGLQGVVQIRMGGAFPVWDAARQFVRLLSAGPDRTTDVEPHAGFRGHAHGHGGRLFRRLHHFFQLRMGNSEDAGRRRMAAGKHLRGGQCHCGIVVVGSRNSPGESLLASCRSSGSVGEDSMTHEKFEGERTLMRIHIGESDKWHGKSLHEAIVEMLRKEKFSGATVLRGVGGFGSSSVYHTDKILRLSQDLPIVVEAIESTERIEQILPRLDEMVEGGLITLEKVGVILYRPAQK